MRALSRWIPIVALGLVVGCGSSKRPGGGVPPVVAGAPAPPAAPRTDAPAAPPPTQAEAPVAPVGTTVAAETAPTGSRSSLEELADDTVYFEDLTPDVVFDEGPASAPSLSLAMLDFQLGRLTLTGVVEKPDGYRERVSPAARPNARWSIEHARTGVVLASGTFEIPESCPCGATEDHVVGDVSRSHRQAFTLELPRHDPEERLRVFDSAGTELGTFDLSR